MEKQNKVECDEYKTSMGHNGVVKLEMTLNITEIRKKSLE